MPPWCPHLVGTVLQRRRLRLANIVIHHPRRVAIHTLASAVAQHGVFTFLYDAGVVVADIELMGDIDLWYEAPPIIVAGENHTLPSTSMTGRKSPPPASSRMNSSNRALLSWSQLKPG